MRIALFRRFLSIPSFPHFPKRKPFGERLKRPTEIIFRAFSKGCEDEIRVEGGCGAAKTHALVAMETGVIRGFGRAGSGNHQAVGLEAASLSIRNACIQAFSQAGCEPPADVGVFGLAGADLPEDFALLTNAMENLSLARKVRVENDAMVALRAEHPGPGGLWSSAGRGFNAAGLAPDGRTFAFPLWVGSPAIGRWF